MPNLLKQRGSSEQVETLVRRNSAPELRRVPRGGEAGPSNWKVREKITAANHLSELAKKGSESETLQRVAGEEKSSITSIKD